MNSRVFPGLYAPLLAAACLTAAAQDLTDLSLEALLDVQVTSVSKKAQALSKTPAAAFVLTHDDIRRSGMTNIPDLLRLVPGVNVARIASNHWAISIRGFNDRYASKVLVMIDGRSVYSSEFSGVFWDQLSVPIEDIERIEVIRGPGGTIWGANAMNGVINIITRTSAQTQGGLIAAGGGSAEAAQTHIRYGGSAGKATYRVYARYFSIDDSEYRDRTRANDGWSGQQAGFRADWDFSPADNLMLAGDLYSTAEGQRVTVIQSDPTWRVSTFQESVDAGNRNFQARWNHIFRNGSEAKVQLFASRATRQERGYRINNTADGEAQYRFGLGQRHDVVAGLGFRHTGVTLDPEQHFAYDQRAISTTLANVFLQDEISLSKSWTLTVGNKFEHNGFTGFEFEPGEVDVVARRTPRRLVLGVARHPPAFLL